METEDGTIGKAGETQGQAQAPARMMGNETGPVQGRGQGPSQGTVPPPPGSWGYPQAPPPYWAWYGQPAAQYPPPERRRSGKPKIVGILLMFSGVLSIIMGGVFGAMMYNVVPWMDQVSQETNGYGEISGQVIFMNSDPAAGVNVSVTDIGLVASTNETGHYRILDVANGWHDLKVEFAGYMTFTKRIYVNAIPAGKTGPVTTADFQLQPGEGVHPLPSGTRSVPFNDTTRAILRTMGGICMTVGTVMGIIAVVGGYFAFRAEKLPIVVLGTICGLLSFGFVIGAVLSFIALILLLLSTDEFERTKKEKEARS